MSDTSFDPGDPRRRDGGTGDDGEGRAGVSTQAVSSGSFGGVIFPPDVLAYIWNTVLTGSPFAGGITTLPTSNGSVAFPTAAPTGAAWVSEGQPLPPVTVGDGALISTPRKLAALLSLSNESLDDASIPIGDLTGQAIRDAMSHQMDDGLLHGTGTPPQPDGILAHATAATSHPDFRQAVIQAWGEVVSAGAPAGSVTAFANPATLAVEWMRAGTTGDPIHVDSPTGVMTIGPGIKTVAVPSLLGGATPEVLVCDTSSVFLVQRESLVIELNPSIYFGSDSTALRVKCRVACACPTPAKSLRKAVIA
jgi:HK97 family phage major capsid protein